MKRTINFFLLLLLFFAPFGLLLRIRITNNVYILPQDIIVGVLGLLVLFFYLKRRKMPKNYIVLKFFLIFIAIGTLSAFINFFLITNYNILVALLYSLRFISYLSLLFIADAVGGKYRKLVLVSGSVILILGFIQYLFYKDLGNLSYLGWDNHLYRLFSTFLDPNFAGAFYVIFFFFLIPMLWKNYKAKKAKNFTLYLFLTSLSVFSIFFTYSRTSLVMLVVGIIIFFMTLKKVRFLLISLFAIAFLLLFVSNFRVEGLNPFRTFSSQARIRSTFDALEIVKNNPILGVGFNGYRYAQVQHGFRSTIGAKISNADAGTDNSFLFVLATSGIFGAAAFLYAYFLILKRINKKIIEGTAAFSLVVSVLIGSLFLNILFYTPFLMWFYLIVGLNFEKKIKVDK